MSKAPYLLFNVILLFKFRQEKEQDLDINNYMMLSVTMAYKTLLIKCQWETVLKKQLMILKLQDKHKMIIVSFLTKDTFKPLSLVS